MLCDSIPGNPSGCSTECPEILFQISHKAAKVLTLLSKINPSENAVVQRLDTLVASSGFGLEHVPLVDGGPCGKWVVELAAPCLLDPGGRSFNW